MEEAGLLGQLGINWKLLASQAVNFFILLVILRQFVYKPLLKVIKERQKKITDGLQKAQEADVRLKEVDEIAKKHLQKADQESIAIIKSTQERASQMQQDMQKKVEDQRKELMDQVQSSYKRQQEEAKEHIFKEAMELVKRTVVKTVQMSPDAIDEALVKKAALEVQKEV